MVEAEEADLIAQIAREAVARAAPAELPLFRATSALYFVDPEKAVAGEKSEDEMLGFGLGDAVQLLTPVALAAAQAVVSYLFQEVKKASKEEAGPIIRRRVKQLFKKWDQPPAKDAPPPPAPLAEEEEKADLTPELAARVRQVAEDTARQMNVPAAQAAVLASAIVGTLVAPGAPPG